MPTNRDANTRKQTYKGNRSHRTVMAAAANTSERVSGDAQDAMRSSLNAASEGTQRITEQVTKLFGLSGENGEEMTRRASQSLQAVTEASTAMTRGFQDLSREFITLSQERMQRNVEALGALSRCRSISEFFALQSELIRDNLQHTLDSTRRMAEVSTRLATEAGQTMAAQAPKGTRRAA